MRQRTLDGEEIEPRPQRSDAQEGEPQCEHDPPAATVFYSTDECPFVICDCGENETDFAVRWISTDAWRGYYEVAPSPQSGWVELHDDCILAWSEDAAELAEMDKVLRAWMDEHDIPYARVFARSSNVFSQGYTMFVKKEHLDEVVGFAANLKVHFRDGARFVRTALFGGE